MGSRSLGGRRVVGFVALIFLMSAAFYTFGPSIGSLAPVTRADLPASALMVVCPGLAAVVLIRRRHGVAGVRLWVSAACTPPRVRQFGWYATAVFLMPLVLLVPYLGVQWTGTPLPGFSAGWSAVPVLAALYLASSLAEELGWSAYLTAPLRERFGALGAGAAIGVIWAAWHVVPYLQAGHNASWILWQCLFTVGLRIVLTWLWANTGGGLLAPVLGHASYNVAWTLSPDAGSQYDPAVAGPLVLAVAVLIALLWGPATLAERPRQRMRRARRPAARITPRSTTAGRRRPSYNASREAGTDSQEGT
ncbi:CPBP family intramembrane glutamic endopeptidase [Micromonospora sp. NPDC126480]|uniref:CPBP family intramembrane glutamic endopeptidase n=1 Tax=Micromonospora sp. NPDC126480 TaxID=3155312 RepID=UPI00332F7F64